MSVLGRLPFGVDSIVNSYLPAADRINQETTCRSAKVTQEVKDQHFTACASSSHSENPLQGRTSVVIDTHEHVGTKGDSKYGQIEFECLYDANTVPKATLEQIRLKQGYLDQLYLNSSQGAEADLGECAKRLLQQSCHIQTLTLDAAIADQLIGRAEQTAAATTLLTLLDKVHQIEFETATPFTLDAVIADLSELGFTLLESFELDGIYYWTLCREN